MRRLYPQQAKKWEYWENLPGKSFGAALALGLQRISPGKPALVLCENSGQAERLALQTSQYGSLLKGWNHQVQVWPGMDGPTENSQVQAEWDRLAILTAWKNASASSGSQPAPLLFASIEAIKQKIPSAQSLETRRILLKPGGRADLNDIAEQLGKWGYHHEVVCESPGEFSVRGGILDVYPIQADAPVRIDFFDDEIESIRLFDPTSQRTDATISEILILGDPPSDRESLVPFARFLSSPLTAFMVRPSVLEERCPEVFEVPETIAPPHPTLADLWEGKTSSRDIWIGLEEVPAGHTFQHPECQRHTLGIESTEIYQSSGSQIRYVGVAREQHDQLSRQQFIRQLYRWHEEGFDVHCFLRTPADQERVTESIRETLGTVQWLPEFASGEYPHGFLWNRQVGPFHWPLKDKQSAGTVFTSDSEILGRAQPVTGRMRKRRTAQRSQVDQLLDFSELADGDYLVHIQHGICQFRGITRIDHRGVLREVLSLEFADSVTLHLPLHEAHLITRYVGLTRAIPKLDKLGGEHWNKTRKAAERAALDYAAEMLRMQAERETHEAPVFPSDSSWLRQFEGSFPYKETRDQHKAIVHTAQDLSSTKPMERLICGDVGFGKTEIALRAAFQAVMGNAQVAIVAPTTVLCQQHFNTFRQRMAGYPITVEMLSSFRKPKEQAIIREQLKLGEIDIIVGTHSLFSKSVEFSRLGLIVIDEEHRFGVRQKENLKRLKSTVHILTMSATPIPRTLYMALMGARDLSVIETPPTDRLPIQTFVQPFDEELIRTSINRELERGGQVFYLHNRIQSIEKTAQMLQELCPRANIGIGHGQMDKTDLEKIMTRFVSGEYDILVCTTIIESGLDIPNCNTMIIEAADRFGLAQLYQLRGRVGRFNRQAYAYLLLKRHGRVLAHARERLNSLRQNTQLGAGFRIAMRDLELRGAGNILGVKQSGFIADIGFELYCDLLRQSIARLKGEPVASRVRATLRLDFSPIGEGSAYPEALRAPEIEAGIPTTYLNETRLRIDYFRKLALCNSPADVQEVRTEMTDRFGAPPPGVEALLQMTHIRCLAESKGIILVEVDKDVLRCKKPSVGNDQPYVKIGNRFPRLTRKSAMDRFGEILHFLNHFHS